MNLVILHSAFTVFLFLVFIAILVWACQSVSKKGLSQPLRWLW